ncbi:NCK-interacting protein with SH3 domain [Nymphon striatum]|nr:NCK-interacting protein with SH3 domain [Nymphon striatum]
MDVFGHAEYGKYRRHEHRKDNTNITSSRIDDAQIRRLRDFRGITVKQLILSSHGNVYVALYDFKSEHAETVSLRKGERVLLLDDTRTDKSQLATNISDWCLVQNIRGDLGFAPRNYINIDVEKLIESYLVISFYLTAFLSFVRCHFEETTLPFFLNLWNSGDKESTVLECQKNEEIEAIERRYGDQLVTLALCQNGQKTTASLFRNKKQAQIVGFLCVPLNEELDFIEGCIEAIHIQATSAGGKYTNQQHQCLQYTTRSQAYTFSMSYAFVPPTPLKLFSSLLPSVTTFLYSCNYSVNIPIIISDKSDTDISASDISVQCTCACIKLVGMRCEITSDKINVSESKSSKRRAPAPPIRKSSSQNVIQDQKTKSEKRSLQKKSLSLVSDSPSCNELSIPESEKARLEDSCIAKEGNEEENENACTTNDLLNAVDTPNVISNDILKTMPENLGLKLVELIRTETNANHHLCVSTVVKMMSMLSSSLPSLSDVFLKIYNSASNSKTYSQKLESEDGQKMLSLLNKLEGLKNEGHELNWNIKNEEGINIQHINDLIDLMMVADPEVCRQVLEYNDFNILSCLVTYYRMKLFKCFCFIESKSIGILVTSVLPLELSREISASVDDKDKLTQLGYLFMILFSTGDCIPVHHYEYIDVNFINLLFDLIDKYDDSECHTADILVSVVLAFNLHFKEDDRNIVMEALVDRLAAKSFTEKIMLLINREDDPVKLSDDAQPETNSVVKLVLDMCSSAISCQLFYTNDIKVLIDIVLRQISDLSSCDVVRNIYLNLLQKIITNAEYIDHLHRLNNIKTVLDQIDKEEDFCESDQQLCRQIKKLLLTLDHKE